MMTILSMIITMNVLNFLMHPYLSNGDSIITPQYVHYSCPRGEYTYAAGSTFEANLTNTLVNILPINASLTGYSKINSGEETVNQVNALAYCRADIKGRHCRGCVEAAARTIIQRCRLLKEGIIWYEKCTLRYRYANQSSMFLVDNLEVTPNHRYYNFSGTFRYLEDHEMIFDSLMNRLVHEAAYVGNQSGFATGESDLSGSNWMLRSLVQCRPDIEGDYCERCLRQALRQRDDWNTPMVFLPSCSIRYDLYPNAHTTPASPRGHGVSLKIKVPVVIVCVLVLCCIIFLAIRHRCCNLQGRHLPEHEQEHPRKFSYVELVWATACFCRRRILGKGGFGNVYRATLFDGTLVTVKRLNVRGALQGEAEFISEVTTITHLNHDNIVSLKGYCTFRRERMLVYNFVANKTLQHHLHGNGKEFSWEKRMKTALSLAEVFAFLHERNPAIIHRDIKPSNILFDDEFQPKVGDFGVARLCSDSRTHLTTIIRGSPGYVDPDYFTSEHLSRKSDVFAFGVVLLELITGRKAISSLEEIGGNKHIIEWAHPLIKKALSSVGNFDALADKNLGISYSCDEMDRMVTCAATCVRKDPEERPTMRQIAEVLKESNESSREFKERLMGYWQRDEAQRRFYGEGGLSDSPRPLGSQIVNGYSDKEIPSANIESTRNPESHEFYYTASP